MRSASPLEQVGDADVVGEAGAGERRQVGGGVQHDLDVVVAGVLGEVQAKGAEPVLVLAGRGVDRDELRREGRFGHRRERCDRRAARRSERHREGGGDAEGRQHRGSAAGYRHARGLSGARGRGRGR